MNVYGWSAANEKEEKAEKTDDLLCTALEEMGTWNNPLVLIAGDLNGSIDTPSC